MAIRAFWEKSTNEEVLINKIEFEALEDVNQEKEIPKKKEDKVKMEEPAIDMQKDENIDFEDLDLQDLDLQDGKDTREEI